MPDSPASDNTIKGTLLLFKIPASALGTARSSSRSRARPAARAPRSTSTSRSAPVSAASRTCARDRRGRLAAGARADEHHRDRHARACRPARRRRTRRRCRPRRPRAARSGRLGSGSSWVVSRSSAVPVLPATLTPGIAAPRRSRPDDRAHEAADGARRRRSVVAARPRSGSRPCGASAALLRRARRSSPRRGHLQRRRQHPALADRGRADGEVVADLLRLGHRRARGPASAGSALKPNFSAVATSRFGPQPGAERGEDRVAGVGEGVLQRAAARLAVGVLQLDALEHGRGLDGELGRGLATPASSAPDEVMILNVEPGGWGAEEAMPASASTSPVLGRRTATPPKRPASASTAARWTSGSIVVRTALPRCGSTGPARARRRAARRRGGRPAASNSRSSPVSPTSASCGTPRRSHSSARSGGRAEAAGDLGGQRAELGLVRLALRERRAVARQDVARGGMRRAASAARRAAGRGRRARRVQSTAAPSSSTNGSATARDRPNTRVRSGRGWRTSRPRARPAGRCRQTRSVSLVGRRVLAATTRRVAAPAPPAPAASAAPCSRRAPRRREATARRRAGAGATGAGDGAADEGRARRRAAAARARRRERRRRRAGGRRAGCARAGRDSRLGNEPRRG